MITIIENEGRVLLDALDCKLLKQSVFHYISDLPVSDPNELQRFQELFEQLSNIYTSLSK